MKQKVSKHIFWNRIVVVAFVALLCCFLWGSAFPSIKIGYAIYGISADAISLQILFAGVRFVLAGILALLIGSIANRRFLLPKRTSLRPILHLSLLQTTCQYFFFYVGLGQTSGVKASIIEALNVFVAIFVACFLFHQEKLAGNKIIGAVLGFVGVFLIEVWGSRSVTIAGGSVIGIGEICIFLSTVAYAFSSVYLKKYSKDEHPFVLSGYQFIVGGCTLIVLGILLAAAVPATCGQALSGQGHAERVSTVLQQIFSIFVTKEGLAIVCYLALVSAVAYSLWGLLLQYNPVSRVAVFGFTNPLFGVVLSALLLGEAKTLRLEVLIASLVLISVGTLLAQRD